MVSLCRCIGLELSQLKIEIAFLRMKYAYFGLFKIEMFFLQFWQKWILIATLIIRKDDFSYFKVNKCTSHGEPRVPYSCCKFDSFTFGQHTVPLSCCDTETQLLPAHGSCFSHSVSRQVAALKLYIWTTPWHNKSLVCASVYDSNQPVHPLSPMRTLLCALHIAGICRHLTWPAEAWLDSMDAQADLSLGDLLSQRHIFSMHSLYIKSRPKCICNQQKWYVQ